MRIAAYLNADGELGDFPEAGSICVFDRQEDRWEIVSTAPISVDDGLSLTEMKKALGDVVHPIQLCQVFLVRELRGVFRVFLEDWGFHVWKSHGTLEQQLDEVQRLETLQSMESSVPVLPKPVEVLGTGIYHINLIELMQAGVPHVSREILIPFFDTTAFAQLHIVSDHLPRWLPFEVEDLGLRIASQTPNPNGEGMQIVVVPACGASSCPKGRRKREMSCSCGG